MTLIGSVPTGMWSAPTGGEFRPLKTILEQYFEELGKMSGGLHTFEIALRQFLFHHEGSAPFIDLEKLSVGDPVPENALTDYSSLGPLIERYNRAVAPRDHALLLPKDQIVNLRDALAHGRVLSKTGAPPFRLVTFSNPRKGQIKVQMVVALDAPWLQSQQRILLAARTAVAQATG